MKNLIKPLCSQNLLLKKNRLVQINKFIMQFQNHGTGITKYRHIYIYTVLASYSILTGSLPEFTSFRKSSEAV